jgi:hypothetical protein
MAGKLRFFLYRDDAIVSQFLEQLEGGVYDEESISQQAGGGMSLKGALSVGPVDVGASRDRSSSATSQMNLRQTGPSRFSRFHELATASDDIQPLDALDNQIWDQLEYGELIDCRVVIKVPEILKSLGIVNQVANLLPLFDAVGSVPGEDGTPLVDPREMADVKKKLPLVQRTAAITDGAAVPVTATLASGSKLTLFMRLSRTSLLVEDLSDLEGEARLVATIQSKVQRGKPVQVGQVLPGLPSANRAQRRKGGASDSSDITLRYPGAVVTPLAIFR